MTGYIRWYDELTGDGVLRDIDTKTDFYFHWTSLVEGPVDYSRPPTPTGWGRGEIVTFKDLGLSYRSQAHPVRRLK